MGRPKYLYSHKTLRFERARISIINVLMTVVALLCFGAVFFVGLFFLQNKLIITPKEKALQIENKALEDHKVVLASRLDEAKVSLANLQKQEEELYSKFFDLELKKESTQPDKNILLGDAVQFNSTLGKLNSKFERAVSQALITNDHYSRYASVLKTDIEAIANFPGAMPVENAEPKMLVSGFGKRINPWHKGKYHHDGVDFAGARDSKVLAAGNGKVVSIKKSDLQAGFGNYVEIDHGGGYITRYTHLGEILVRSGQKVKKGEAIASMGISGGSIAPHVHYEVIKDGKNIDPVRVLVEGISSHQFHLLTIAASQLNQSLD